MTETQNKGKGRGTSTSRKPKEKKPLTRLEEMAKQAYETKKINSTISSDSNLSLRSFKGVRASSSEPPMSARPKKFTNGDNKFNNKPPASKSGKPAQKKPAPPGSKFNGKPQSKTGPKPKSLTKRPGHATAVSNTTFNPKEPALKGSSEKFNEVSKVPDTKEASLSTTRKQGSSAVKKATKIPSKGGKGNDKASHGRKGQAKQAPAKFKASPTKSGTYKSANVIPENKSVAGKTQHVKKQPQEAPVVSSQLQQPNLEDCEEGEPLKKFTQYTPKSSYPNLDEYFNEFSFALFLEERLENDFLQNFEITWAKDPKERALVVRMRADSDELKKLLPSHLVKLGRLPFTKQQPLMLTSQDETKVWYTFVRELDSKKNNITMLLELYSWNKLQLPIRAANEQFKILPCSAQVNRIMFAMTRVQNPKFIKLLLGQELIKQVNFNNRLQFTKDTFNDSQKSAIQHVLNNSITVLQGPPGTGKTSTIEEIILQVLSNFHTIPILCVAASNIAIDNIAEKFMVGRPDIKILRILSQSKEAQYNNEHMLGKICLHNIVYEQLPSDMKDNISKLRSGVPGLVSKNQYSKLLDTQNAISDRHIAQAQIIFTTNIASGGRQLKAIKELPVVIMDESTQSSEVSTLVPLSLPGIKRFVFVGDEKQLSSFSNVPQLEMSLFERILTNGTYENPHMLDTQYRMHPAISEFPIKTFYNGMLKDGVTAEQKSWPGLTRPLFFFHCNNGPENKVFNSKRGMRGFTYNNTHEAEAIVAVLHKLIIDKKVGREEIGVITPYSSQRDLISEMLVRDPVVNPSGKAMEQEMDKDDVLGGGESVGGTGNKVTINIVNGVFVATVDSFQGHEKQFVVFSCVRNNSENNIGFVKDRRRMNVALTRAKNGLVVVGNKDVMRQGDPLWAEYVDYVEEKNVVFESLDEY
ncbi:LANO_0C05886g1_1 [Lachancea nothofagi CBS 11611]|uniref:LANO_0C05886g1_1 n=1 Tax=Lachancea nothofagi CBS 11611 TaxID=1266666 RepID=A0A1G4J7N3_9SACH|nr:LANO_0C05886g1_1 [Lachancea nothofagi CBS 11611]